MVKHTHTHTHRVRGLTRQRMLAHSPALRLRGKLLVERQGEAKKSAIVPQLVQRVRGVEVEAARLAAEAQQSPEEASPAGGGGGEGGHRKVHSRVHFKREGLRDRFRVEKR